MLLRSTLQFMTTRCTAPVLARSERVRQKNISGEGHCSDSKVELDVTAYLTSTAWMTFVLVYA